MQDNGYCHDCISGVGCDVNTCFYHGKDNRCHAQSISVRNSTANERAETYCGTFVSRTEV